MFSIPETRARKFDPKADRREYSYRKRQELELAHSVY
jgi:hypothetical protein